MKRVFIIAAIVLCSFNSFSQGWSVGIGGIYDFQNGGIGADLRALKPIGNRLAIVPQIHYFFGFNPVQEFYLGLHLQYSLFHIKRWTVYPLAGAYYNRWQNSYNFEGSIVKPNNIAEDAGIGIMKNTGCLKPFIEQRYDFKWKEFMLHAGIYITFGDCFGNNSHRCPAYK